jgi:phage-related baseplate assembly protein
VLAEAEKAVTGYVKENHKLGRDITQSGLYAALHQAGVQRVELTAPAADIVVTGHQAAYCTAVSVVIGGRDE